MTNTITLGHLGNISHLEVFVVAVGLVGAAVSLLMLTLLWRDRHELIRNKQNGVDRRLVMGNVRNVLFMLFIVLIFIALGAYAMFLPEPIRTANRRASELINWALISIEVVATLTILWDYWDRRRNMRDLARRIVDHKRRHDDVYEDEREARERRERRQERKGEQEYQGDG